MIQTKEEIIEELLAKGLCLSACLNYDREDLAYIQWLHTGKITPPFINYLRKNILGLEVVDKIMIADAIKMMEMKKIETNKKSSKWTYIKTLFLGLCKR